MLAPSIPAHEKARLTALHALKILDTEPEERFDRITRLCRRLFDVPIALVSLIDHNRQWFKSHLGIETKQTARNISFCAHAIHSCEAFIVNDTRLDERFKDNPLVVNEPHIRFYAGKPILAPNKQAVGTLCIIDTKPRKFSQDDIAALSDLAAMVTDEFIAMQLATMDALTDISNRRGLIRLGQHCIDNCLRQNSQCHLVYFDLNDFKHINDNYGHEAGDYVLKIFAEQLMHTFRVSDICARLGGDEFAVLLTNTQANYAQEVISRLSTNLSRVVKQLSLPYEIAFAFGLASLNQQHVNIEQLIHDADQKMYINKKANKKK